jgi:hypothetical protein
MTLASLRVAGGVRRRRNLFSGEIDVFH